jgi:hypothetical protein
MSLQSRKTISITMCKFIIVMYLNGQIFRKGPAFCENGMRGEICIDTQKIYAPPNTQTVVIRSGNAIVSTPTITSMMIENFLQSSTVMIESDVIAPYLQTFVTARIGCIEQMYVNMKRYGNLYAPSVESPAVSIADSLQTTKVSRSSRIKIQAPSTVGPCDSISQVSRSSSRRHEDDHQDLKGSVVEWMEKSTEIGTTVTERQRSSRAPATMISNGTSRGSSRRMSSYAMARQMTIME